MRDWNIVAAISSIGDRKPILFDIVAYIYYLVVGVAYHGTNEGSGTVTLLINFRSH